MKSGELIQTLQNGKFKMVIIIGLIFFITMGVILYFLDKEQESEKNKQLYKNFEKELQLPKCKVILKLKGGTETSTDYLEPKLIRNIAYDLIIPSRERAQNLIDQLFNNGYLIINERIIFIEQLEDVQLELENK